ncbi:MAG: hypothetical protein LBK63_13095 [Treponema sp.]|jgi:hypothetical protein|nr:hypothetical protein [Treponema sp.]
MTIEQNIEIPEDRRITLELPAQIPAGAARIKVFVSPDIKAVEKTVKMSRQMRRIMQFYGCLKDSPVFEGDPVEIQRRMRSEWDRSWDKNG